MPNPQIYTNELENFRNKYNMPSYDLGNFASLDKKFRYVNDFLFNDTVGGDDLASQFTNWANKTLSMYFEANTTLNAAGKYMSSFRPKEFLKDFDRLADAKYRSELKEGEESSRKKFAGAKMSDLKRIFVNAAKDMNKTLPTLWKDKLKKGTMDITALQVNTMNIMNTAMGTMTDKTGLENKITNVVAAREALKQLRESRKGFVGWFWKRFNKDRNEIEKNCLDMFEKQVNWLRQNGYDVDKIAADLTSKTVWGLEAEGANRATTTAPQELETQEQVADNNGFERTHAAFFTKENGIVKEVELEKEQPNTIENVETNDRVQIDGSKLESDVNGKDVLDKSSLHLEDLKKDAPTLENKQ